MCRSPMAIWPMFYIFLVGAQALNHFDLTSTVTEIQDLARHPDEMNLLKDTFFPVSALRDPVDGKVRVFLLAEDYAMPFLSVCYFTKGRLPLEFNSKEKGSQREWVSMQGEFLKNTIKDRRYNAHMITCPDPGAEYDTYVFRIPAYNDLVLKTVDIEAVENDPKGVGSCVIPLYSKRPMVENWIMDTLATGVSKIHLYYTHVAEHEKSGSINFFGAGFGGIHMENSQFEPIDHPQVWYYKFHHPQQTWHFSHALMLTECLHRKRYTHNYLIMADTDEFLTVRAPDASLEAMLQRVIPSDTASAILHVVWYPLQCQEYYQMLPDLEESYSVVNNSHMATSMYMVQPKSIVVPSRALSYKIHTLGEHLSGFKGGVHLSSSEAFFKHVRNAGKNCPEDVRSRIIDDRDKEAFDEVMLAFDNKLADA